MSSECQPVILQHRILRKLLCTALQQSETLETLRVILREKHQPKSPDSWLEEGMPANISKHLENLHCPSLHLKDHANEPMSIQALLEKGDNAPTRKLLQNKPQKRPKLKPWPQPKAMQLLTLSKWSWTRNNRKPHIINVFYGARFYSTSQVSLMSQPIAAVKSLTGVLSIDSAAAHEMVETDVDTDCEASKPSARAKQTKVSITSNLIE